MISKQKWIRESFGLASQLARQQVALLLGLFLVSLLLNLTGEDAMQLMDSTQESERLFAQLGLGIWDLIEGVMLILVLSWGIPKVRSIHAATLMPKPFNQPYIGAFLAEYLRTLAQILMWALLILLPGFWRYSQLIFVPMVALFSKAYRDGEVDALKLSETLARGRMTLIVVTLLLTTALQFGVQMLPEMVTALHIYPVRIAAALLGYIISVWTFSLMYLLFEHAMEEISTGTAEPAT